MHEKGQEERRDPFPLQHSPATLSDLDVRLLTIANSPAGL